MCDDEWDNPSSNWCDNLQPSRNYESNGGRQNQRTRNRERGSDRDLRRWGNDDTRSIKVLTKFVGRIIGRGGVKIKDLEMQSGGRINVTRGTKGDETIIKISGAPSAISKAESLVRELTIERDSYAPRQELTKTETLCNQQEPPKTLDWKAIFAKSDENEAAEWALLPAIKKNFYDEHPAVAAMSDQEVKQFRVNSNNIVVKRILKNADSGKAGKPIPKPVKTFEQAFYNYYGILREIKEAGFSTPSPIQSQAWPILLSGEDLIGIAQTGTGKTLAFLLPALIHIDGQNIQKADRKGPAVLIMAPTRELALQINKEVKKYKYRDITAVCVYGGADCLEQIESIKNGVDIVIGTPGRLNYLIYENNLEIKYISYVVLDEADRMLDMGFEPQIRRILYRVNPTRQTVMTSATWPVGVHRLANSYMVDPIQVYVGSLDLAATRTVTQIIKLMPDNDEEKFKAFMDFAKNLDSSKKVIVFCGKKARVTQLATDLIQESIQCQTIHGDRDQSDREQALIDIANGRVRILVATDVASRGLDIEDITHVVNFDFPRNIEEYVHRVGRTGRAGKSGISISYLCREDWAHASKLIDILNKTQQYVPGKLYDMARRYAEWKKKKDSSRPSGRGRSGGKPLPQW